MSVRFTVAMALSLVLAGCGSSDGVETTEEGAKAQGEILGGTISDEMVPLEEVRSASPPAKKEAGEGGQSSSGDSAGSDDGGTNEAGPEEESAAESEPAETEESAEEG